MAVSLHKREGTRNWQVRYTDSRGKPRRMSTGTSDRAEAERMARQVEKALALEASGKLTYQDVEALLGSRESSHPGAPPPDLPAQIDRLERLWLSTIGDQAAGQEIAARQMADLLRELEARTRRLERHVERNADVQGRDE